MKRFGIVIVCQYETKRNKMGVPVLQGRGFELGLRPGQQKGSPLTGIYASSSRKPAVSSNGSILAPSGAAASWNFLQASVSAILS